MLRLLIVTPDVSPLLGQGDRSEAVGGLAEALCKAGSAVTVIAPYATRDVHQKHGLARRLVKLTVDIAGKQEPIGLLEGKLGNCDARVLLLTHPLFDTDILPTNDSVPSGRAHAIFARAALQAIIDLPLQTDVIHAHDWPTGLVPLFAHRSRTDSVVRDLPVVFTLYSPEHLGTVASVTAGEAAWLDQTNQQAIALADDSPSLLKAGLHFSDAVVLDSVSAAEAVVTHHAAGDLEQLLAERVGAIGGVAPGLDYELWNPETSHHIAAGFSVSKRANRSVCKAALLDAMRLQPKPSTPVVSVVAPLDRHGIDLLLPCLATLPELGIQLLVFGDTAGATTTQLGECLARYPDLIAVSPGTPQSGDLQRILAGSDAIWLVPAGSHGGNLALKAMRFGAIPMVSPKGGLRDVVVDFDRSSRTGTGLWLDTHDPNGAAALLNRLGDIYSVPALWQQLQQNAMHQRHLHETSAERYLEIYSRLLAEVPAELTV